MNSTCIYPVSSFLKSFGHVFAILSAPIYIIACYILIFKCPVFFKAYRVLLLRHIMTCIVTEYHMDLIWQLTIVLPYTAMCSTGVGSSNPVIMLLFEILVLILTAISVIDLFQYRVQAVTTDAQQSYILAIRILKYLQCFIFAVCFLVLIVDYPNLSDQHEYKKSIEVKYGDLPSFIWCDSCFFLTFNSFYTKSFLVSAMFTQPLAITFYSLCVYTSKIGLNTLKSSLSAKTIEIQKNFLNSLYIQTSVHLIFISIPLLVLFSSYIFWYPSSSMYMSHILVTMFNQHGSLSTFALLLTNKALHTTIRKVASNSFNFISNEPQVFGATSIVVSRSRVSTIKN